MVTINIKPKKRIIESTLYPHLATFQEGFTEILNTLPNGGGYQHYPDPIQEKLRCKYAQHLNEINRQDRFASK